MTITLTFNDEEAWRIVDALEKHREACVHRRQCVPCSVARNIENRIEHEMNKPKATG